MSKRVNKREKLATEKEFGIAVWVRERLSFNYKPQQSHSKDFTRACMIYKTDKKEQLELSHQCNRMH